MNALRRAEESAQADIRSDLRRRRRALGLTQAQAAQLLGIPRLDYHRIGWLSRVRTLAQYGATPEEIAFLRNRRVELNAMTSRQFVDHLEACNRARKRRKPLAQKDR